MAKKDKNLPKDGSPYKAEVVIDTSVKPKALVSARDEKKKSYR